MSWKTVDLTTKSGIYKITNTLNGKFYIGSAVNIRKRAWGHKHGLKNGKHVNSLLQRAWDKYGAKAFIFEVIEIVSDVTKLIEVEQRYIDTFDCVNKKIGYNLAVTAGSMLGYKHSEQSRKRMSISAKCKPPISEETRKKLSEAGRGRKRSKEAIEKYKLTRNGKGWSEESKKIFSEKMKGKTLSDAHKQAIRKSMNSISLEQKEEMRRKKSESLKLMHAKRTPQRKKEIQDKINRANSGKPKPLEVRMKISATLTGRKTQPCPEHVKAKISAANKRFWADKGAGCQVN